MNRRKGTSDIVVTYRELAPPRELRACVRAYFSFIPGAAAWRGQHAVMREVQFTRGDSFCSPRFADGHASLVIELGAVCDLDAGWTLGAPLAARSIGALRRVGAPAGSKRPEMLGVYFEPGATSTLLDVPAVELTDRIVDLQDLWGSSTGRLLDDLAELDEAGRVNLLERELLWRARRAARPDLRIDVAGLARWVRAEPRSITVRRLADSAGVSRQHLTRVFRQVIGVSPKRYCRLARFKAALGYAGAGAGVDWAQIAADLGYADQSHMIAEFRELSSLTPHALASGRWFHPFILEARSLIAKA